MGNYNEFLKEDMRLVVLRLLSELPQYRSNSSVLCTGLDSFGHCFSRDQVKTELHWLDEQGCIQIETDLGSVLVVKLTERGLDVATGRIKAHGIKKPGA